MKKLLLILFLCICTSTYAQRETHWWYFGDNAGLDFNTLQSLNSSWGTISNLPTAIKGPLKMREGCFTLSDKSGKFLFASDGMNVYNGPLTTDVMHNGTGLLGHPSATQSGIVIPIPETPNKYYIVTSPVSSENIAARYGQHYYTVDMTQQGGKGSVIDRDLHKDLPLSNGTISSAYSKFYAAENATVIGHSNGIDYWLLSRMLNQFMVWSITKEGIKLHDIVVGGTSIGRHPSPRGGGLGTIKVSPNGKKIAYGHYGNGEITLGDFDAQTGKITNVTTIATGTGGSYGVEFSPNGKYLYMTCIENGSYNGLYIRHIDKLGLAHGAYTKAADGALITNVQLGRHNRIYAIAENDRSLWVILDPDNGGTKIAKFENFFLAGTLPRIGLPPFITSFFTVEKIQGNKFPCISGKEEVYTVEFLQGSGHYKVHSIEWDFGDGTPKIKENYINNQTQYSQSHKYKSLGTRNITITPYREDGTAITDEIIIEEATTRYCNLIINSATTQTLIKR